MADAKEGAVIYNSALMNLDEVIDVMKDAEDKGLKVARVHTGDPAIYGAHREQMDRLDELGIDYEVIPGVSSFLATAAVLKKEYTLPGVSQTVRGWTKHIDFMLIDIACIVIAFFISLYTYSRGGTFVPPPRIILACFVSCMFYSVICIFFCI